MPTAADWYETGNTLYAAGYAERAIDAYQQALTLSPDFADVYNNLGNALSKLGNARQAIESYGRAIQLRPDFYEAHHNLAAVLQSIGRYEEAAESYRCALRSNPNLPADVHNQLGIVLMRTGQFEPAAESFRQAVTLRPDFAEGHNNLANALHKLERASESIASYRRALALRPESAEIFTNLGNVLKETGQLDHALACHHRATELRTDYADAYNNLANTLKDTGRLDQAIACYDSALAVNPDHVAAHSSKIYTLHFHPDSTPQSLADAHRQWNLRHAAPMPRFADYGNARDPDRRLRIGYVSPDFRNHVVGRFLSPLFSHHDHHQFEIVAYSSVARPDLFTPRFQQHADVWQNVLKLSDEELAERIHADRIDILVDLTLHMAGSRLLVFARKPAPLQITYLAYCSTTGLDEMDYRFTDPHLDSSDANIYSERSLYLRSYWCYEPPETAPNIAPLPCTTTGRITFGCLNNFCKITGPTFDTWSKLMQIVPNSRLILHAHPGTHRQEALVRFAEHGIAADRIEFAPFAPLPEYLARYQQIDIALDPFPYAGGTTTCDALWMGIPVVSLAGNTAVSRSGSSILSTLGLIQLLARTSDQYIGIASALAADPVQLQYLRSSLRDRMAASPLMDAAGFARDVERAYRQIWTDWCNNA